MPLFSHDVLHGTITQNFKKIQNLLKTNTKTKNSEEKTKKTLNKRKEKKKGGCISRHY